MSEIVGASASLAVLGGCCLGATLFDLKHKDVDESTYVLAIFAVILLVLSYLLLYTSGR